MWISPYFAVQVCTWLDQLLLTGKVELGKEKSNNELDEIFNTISINYQLYSRKDIVYFYEFTPSEQYKDEYKEICELNRINNRKFYEFGVTSDITDRRKGHNNDKNKMYPKLVKCFVYKSRANASDGEAYLKQVVKDLNLKLVYYKSLECFTATKEETEKIYTVMEEHSTYDKIEEDNKHKIEIQKLKMHQELFEKGKLTFEQFQSLVK